MSGLTENGLAIRTQPELQAKLEETLAAALPGLDLSAGPEHQVIGVLSEELALVWETLQAVLASFDPDQANGILLDVRMALTGSVRRAATRSTVTAQVTLAATTTLPAGTIAAVLNAPGQQFRTIAAVTNSDGSPATLDVVLESVETGPVAAPAHTLTVPVTAVTGWTAITNALDAELGRHVAADPEAREQRVIELAGAGQDSYAAIRAKVAKVTGVISVTVFGNETLGTVSGRPGKSFEVVVWDADAAEDDAIAQAIWDSKPAGIIPFGVDWGGIAQTETLENVDIAFSRAAALRVYCALEVVLRPGAGADWATQAAEAISARGLLFAVGETGYVSQLSCAVLDAVPGIEAVTSIVVGLTSSPAAASVAPTYAQIIRIASGDVDATEAA